MLGFCKNTDFVRLFSYQCCVLVTGSSQLCFCLAISFCEYSLSWGCTWGGEAKWNFGLQGTLSHVCKSQYWIKIPDEIKPRKAVAALYRIMCTLSKSVKQYCITNIIQYEVFVMSHIILYHGYPNTVAWGWECVAQSIIQKALKIGLIKNQVIASC